jgi:hypothetical protein
MSTDNAIFKLIESVFKAWNQKDCIAGVFCDLSRAFDYVAHDLLIKKNWNFMELGVYIWNGLSLICMIGSRELS